MTLKRVLGIAPLLGITMIAACSDVPTVTHEGETRPQFDNGGSYGSGGKAASDSTAPAYADAPMAVENGGSYGSGG